MYPSESIVVVGGGLVGSLCALLMAKRDYKVNLYEYREDPRQAKCFRGKSINLALSNRGRRALAKAGIEEEILKYGIPMKGRYIHKMNGKNKSILYDPRTNQCIYSISRNYLNQRLLEEIESFPNVKMYFNHKLVNVDIGTSRLIFQNTLTGTTVEVKADVIIGADGAFSTVRRALQRTPLFNFSQTYIDHGYVELRIEPTPGLAMEPNHLHIWPRGEFMMIALPNVDGTWTVTLFMPFEKFQQVASSDNALAFFEKYFPDSVELIGKKHITKVFSEIKPSYLVSIKCDSYYANGNTIIIGDAAHAMVPFYGQGMNCGFEDCTLLDSLLESCNNNIQAAIALFTKARRDDAHSICDLAMNNYIEMRHLVTKPSYLIRKRLDDFLFWLLPNVWIPSYNSVTFSEMSYQQCVYNRKWQDKVLMFSTLAVIILSCFAFVLMIKF